MKVHQLHWIHKHQKWLVRWRLCVVQVLSYLVRDKVILCLNKHYCTENTHTHTHTHTHIVKDHTENGVQSMGYSFQLAASDLLYNPTGICTSVTVMYTSEGLFAGV